jgi:hypothetical protein
MPVILVLAVPGGVWSWRAIQLAGMDVADQVWAVLVNLAVHGITASCVISGLDAARAEKKEWLGRGVRKSLRLVGWELLVTFQAAIRAFLPFLPSSASQPKEYQPAKGTAAWWLDRLPLFSGLVYFFSKMGLRCFVAVLTRKPLQECAAVSRRHYLHIGLLNALGLLTQCLFFGLMSNAQVAGAGNAQVPGWWFLAAVALANEVVLSLMTAYGLMLYHDCRVEEPSSPQRMNRT